MIVKAESRYLRISPTKVRQVIELIKGKEVQQAQAVLLNLNKRSKEYLLKILNSAVANAKQKGFKPEESAVSVFLGWGITHPDQSFEKAFHPQIPFWLKFVSPFSSTTILLDPNITHQLKNSEGFDSKEQLIDWIHKNTKVKVEDWLDDFYAVQNFVHPMGKMGQEPIASWMKLPRDDYIPQFSSPSRINIINIGGGTNLFWQATDFGYSSSASVDEWR